MDRQTDHVDTSYCAWLWICHFYVKRVPYSTLGTFFTFCCRNTSWIIHFSISTTSATSKISTLVDLEVPLLHSVVASLHKVSSCTVDCRLLLALAALNVLPCFSIVIGRIALASLTSFCSLALQMMISWTSKKRRISLPNLFSARLLQHLPWLTF
jgi:hypothetical protein